MFFERIALAIVFFILSYLFFLIADEGDAPGLIFVTSVPYIIIGLILIYRAFRKPEKSKY